MGNRLVEHRATHLVSHCINYRRISLLCFLFLFSILTAEATEYVVSPAPNDQFGVSTAGENVQIVEDTVIPYWQFLLWLAAMQILSVIDTTLYLTKFIFLILGFKITGYTSVLDNPSRKDIYVYIKANPGAYFSDIVKSTGLNRGTVQYHIKILEMQNKIEAYEDRGKTKYFQNSSTYNEKEKKFLATFQNVTNQRIILGILDGKYNTNLTLAQEIGISKGTISWYVKNLKEIGLIKETKKGRSVIYKINATYKNLIEKYK